MKTIRRFARAFAPFAALLFVAGFVPFHPVTVEAQTVPLPRTVEPVFGYVSADDTDVAMLFRYIGDATNNSGKVEVTVTTSDLTFTQGPAGSEAASTEFECPVSGALGGIIDVSNAACNTVGEVCDIVNASTNWRCVALDSMRSDSVDGRLLVLAATAANSVNGLAVNWDTSTAFDSTVALTPYRSMADYLIEGTRVLKHDLYTGTRTGVFLGSATSTYGSGTSTIRIYSVDPTQTRANKWSEAETQIYFTPGGATTVAQTFDFRDIGVWGKTDGKVLVRLDNSAAAASVTLRAYGIFARAVPASPGRP